MADRGFDLAGGVCYLCGKLLDRLRDTARAPLFDPASQGHPELAEYIGARMHQDCWYLWEGADTLARLAKTSEAYGRKAIFGQGHFTGVWASRYPPGPPAASTLFFARSTMIFTEYRIAVCEVSGAPANIAVILGLVTEGLLAPGFALEVPRQGGVPMLEVQCHDCRDDRLEVEFNSSRQGINVTCFLRLDDLQDMRDSLKEGATWWEPPPQPQAIYPMGPVGGLIAEFREPAVTY